MISGNRSTLRLWIGEIYLSILLLLCLSILVYMVLLLVMFLTCALIYRKDKHEALDILLKDLKVFSTFSSDAYREISQLLSLNNFRYNMFSQFTSSNFTLFNYIQRVSVIQSVIFWFVQFTFLSIRSFKNLISSSSKWFQGLIN